MDIVKEITGFFESLFRQKVWSTLNMIACIATEAEHGLLAP